MGSGEGRQVGGCRGREIVEVRRSSSRRKNGAMLRTAKYVIAARRPMRPAACHLPSLLRTGPAQECGPMRAVAVQGNLC